MIQAVTFISPTVRGHQQPVKKCDASGCKSIAALAIEEKCPWRLGDVPKGVMEKAAKRGCTKKSGQIFL